MTAMMCQVSEEVVCVTCIFSHMFINAALVEQIFSKWEKVDNKQINK